MAKQPAKNSKFHNFLVKLRLAKPRSSVGSVRIDKIKPYDDDDIRYLDDRPEGSQGPSLGVDTTKSEKDYFKTSGKCHPYQPDVLYDQKDAMSCDGMAAAQIHSFPELGPQSLEFYSYKPEAGESSKIKRSTSAANGEQDTSKLPITGKQKGKGKRTNSSNSKDRPTRSSPVAIPYASTSQTHSSHHDDHYAASGTSSGISYDVLPDQSHMARQYRLLCRLQSTLNVATSIVEDALMSLDRDD